MHLPGTSSKYDDEACKTFYFFEWCLEFIVIIFALISNYES